MCLRYNGIKTWSLQQVCVYTRRRACKWSSAKHPRRSHSGQVERWGHKTQSLCSFTTAHLRDPSATDRTVLWTLGRRAICRIRLLRADKWAVTTSVKKQTRVHTVDWSVSCSLYDAVWKCFCCYGRFALKKKASIPKLSRAIWTRCRCADRLEQERRASECVCSRVDCATVGFTCSIIQLENNCSSTSPRLRHVRRIPKLVAPLHPKSELFEKCHLQSLVG